MRILRRLGPLGEAAMAYAQRGLRVLPCTPQGKAPLIRDWPARATTAPETVHNWWSRWPDANIGLLTGAPNMDVLDIDVRPGGDGFAVLERLRTQGLLDGARRVVRTPSGGEHWYFAGTTQTKSKLSGGYVDFQAGGGYVLAPPSRLLVAGEERTYEEVRPWTASGATLDWAAVAMNRAAPTNAPRIAPRRPLLSTGRARFSAASTRAYLRAARPGERNNRLFAAACRLVERGADPWVLKPLALSLGLDVDEVDNTIRSAVATVIRGRRG